MATMVLIRTCPELYRIVAYPLQHPYRHRDRKKPQIHTSELLSVAATSRCLLDRQTHRHTDIQTEIKFGQRKHTKTTVDSCTCMSGLLFPLQNYDDEENSTRQI